MLNHTKKEPEMKSIIVEKTLMILVFASAIPMTTFADCSSTYTSAANACATAQANRDNAASATYFASFLNAQNTYNSKVSQDVVAAALAQQNCLGPLYTSVGDPNVYMDVGTCGNAKKAADVAADNAYNTAVAACDQNYPTDQAAHDKCVCQAVAARDYSKNSATATATKCAGDAYNTYNNSCMTSASAVQSRDDRQANSQFTHDAGLALATYYKTTVQSGYTRQLCDAQAANAYYNCTLDLDCSQHSANCCVDNCGKQDNNATLAAQTAWVNAVGPADAQRNYDLTMCDTTQGRDDQASYATGQYTIDLANAKYNFDQTTAYNVYQYATGMADAQYTKDTSLCACNSKDQNQYDDCVATANTAKAGAYSNALAAYRQKANGQYDNPVGENWTTWNQAVTSANNTLQAAYATHQLTAQTCRQNAQNTFDAVSTAADAAWNNAAAAADQAYQNCLNGCNHQG